ncbi:ABC transporter substrate-binding protein [Saccharibacillus alkalitolerans]|uniref:ABC transporter substrate-binding protein n=1 Tax=Saccharibacillus alkalitolerans TaxID=2705290 RepID=A0ABX0F7S7_9BACL|nr:ABC transporter substrate-binding protein [Saccharibacillus alkalitolerans]NGZ76363.1 ABC transporter substrate-binding protein [Saccharibacillus alkalitolerans]
MTKKTFKSLAFTLIGGLALVVSACSNDTATNNAATKEPASEQAAGGTAVNEAPAAEETAAPAEDRVMKDSMGHEVTVPAQPKAVIASYLEDSLVALGVKPVAQWMVGTDTVQAYLQESLSGIPGIPSDLPLEVVASYSPDLILMDSAELVAGDKYRQYSAIAPTYVVGNAQNNDWRQELLTVGEVLGKKAEAQKVLDDYEAKAADAKAKLEEAAGGEKKAAALWVLDKDVYVVNQNLSSGDVIYNDLGMAVPDVVKQASEASEANWSSLSLELLAGMDADYIFLVNGSGKDKEQVLADPVWKNIPAVKEGRVYEFGSDSSWLYTGAVANGQMIDDVLSSVAGAK